MLLLLGVVCARLTKSGVPPIIRGDRTVNPRPLGPGVFYCWG